MQDDSSDKAGTLFLSYAHADGAFARRLAKVLQKLGYVIWWDALITGGEAYARSIGDALEKADAVLVLWSANSIESDWVKDEAAQGRDGHRLVPLSVDGTTPPLGFRQYQVIDLSHWHGRANAPEIAATQRAIQTVLSSDRTVSSRSPTKASRRSVLIGGTAAGAAIVAGGSWLAWDRGLFGGGRSPLSIAVLPFRNLASDHAQDYFADGLTEEVRGALTRIPALRVLAGTSSEKASAAGDVKAIAANLGVGFLLSGSVQREGDVARISTDLVDGRTGFSQWSESVDRKLTDIFAVQSDIARTVAQTMSVQVATADPAPGGTHNVQAYEYYLKGRALYGLAKDEATDRTALEYFEMAIAQDPKFALAYAARSRSFASLAGEYAKADQLKSVYSASIASAQKAVELAPNLAEGHLALAFATFTGRLDIKGAWPSYQRAYQLGYGNADIALLYALYCARAGHPVEARTAVDRAVLLDPLNPRAFRAQGSVAVAGRRFADALPPLRRALQLNPNVTFAHFLIGSALLKLGKPADALKEFDAEPEPQFHFTGLAIVRHKLGQDAASKDSFAQLQSKVGDSALYQQAEVLAQWGQAEQALATLQRARQVGDSGLTYAATDFYLDPLRSDPRFRRFIDVMSVS